MKILITGGAGFQGSHLTKHFLKAGHQLSVLNTYSERAEKALEAFRNEIHCIWGSVTDAEIVSKSVRGMDVVFHLAARVNVDESIDDPWSVIDVNIRGTYNVLQAVRQHGSRMIHASTCEVYGAPYPGEERINEQHEMRPYSPYAASKAGADRLCFSYYKTFGTPVTIVRPFNIYGERQKEGKGGAVIAIFVQRALDEQPLIVTGNGQQTRDYMHVSDLVQAYDLVFRHPELQGQAINFGSGIEVSIRDIAQHISKAMGVRVEYGLERPGEVDRFLADTTVAAGLGFKPKVSILEGLDRYIAWRRNTR